MKSISKLVKLSFVFVLMGTVIFTTGCRKEEKPNTETLVLTVNNSKVYMDEIMYHVMLAELQGQLYASFVGNGESYWDMKNEDGSTVSEATKDMAMENAIKYELFNQLALQEGYTLNQEEKDICKSKADNIILSVSPEQLKKTELTETKIIEIQEKIAIATIYYEDYLLKLGINEDSIQAGIDPSNYKQYDIQYIFAKKNQYDMLVSLLVEADTTKDLTTLTKSTELSSGKLSFLEGKDTFGEETNLEDVIKTMQIDEVSDIVETVKGYYVIKMTNNASRKLYDSAVKEETEKAVEEIFMPAYEVLKKEQKIKITDKVWDQIIMGSATINSENK